MLNTAVSVWAQEHPTAKAYVSILEKNHVTFESFTRPDIAEDLVAIKDENGRQAIPTIVAKDIVAKLKAEMRFGEVAVFWDIENVRPPSGVSAAEAASALIRGLESRYGNVRDFKVYTDLQHTRLSRTERVGLQDAKVDVIDACHNQRKEVADKMIIVDALFYALDYSRLHEGRKPIICIVSGDSDFSPLVSKLARNGYHSVCIHHSTNVRSLHKHVGQAFTWAHFDLLPEEKVEEKVVPVQSQSQDQADVPVVTSQAVADLLAIIQGCRGDADGRVKRSALGVPFRERSLNGSLKEAIDVAVSQELIKVGGTHGNAWVQLVATTEFFVIVSIDGPHINELKSVRLPGGAKFINSMTGPNGCVSRVMFGPFNSDEAAFDACDVFDFLESYEYSTSDTFDGLGRTEYWVTPNVEDLTRIIVEDTPREYTEFVMTQGLRSALTQGANGFRFCKYANKPKGCKSGSNCEFIHPR